MGRYLTRDQVQATYPDPGTVMSLLRAHGHHPRLNLTTDHYRRPWHIGDDALCAQVDPDLWFPEKGGTAEPAKRICASCPARQDCLIWAIQARERFGVWGGIGERDRRPLIRAAGRPDLDTTDDTEEIEEAA